MWLPWVTSSNHFELCETEYSTGPLITMGFIYHLIGLLISLVIREIFWVPHRFRSGVIAAGVWSNFGDIRESIKTVSQVK
jgi:predicted permease